MIGTWQSHARILIAALRARRRIGCGCWRSRWGAGSSRWSSRTRFVPAGRAVTRDALGQDFLAFYSAGQLVDHGQAARLYDLSALSALQQSIAMKAGFRLAAPVAPWWNPPYVAWLFVPFSRLSFYPALIAWTVFSVACLAGAVTLLANLIRSASERKRDWLLVPALIAIAPPTIQSLGHGQNTALSLLVLTLAVLAWRSRRPLLTGFACAMLCYKPQLAMIVSLAAFATLGWRVAVGALVGLVPVLLLTVNAMPGALGEFVTRVPTNLHAIQFDQIYLWHRHVTFEGFLRFFFQGNSVGVTREWIHLAAIGGIAAVGAILTFAWRHMRSVELSEPGDEEIALDRFIALVILATPLAMPFFFDYDLLLLAVPCVLIAREMMLFSDRSPAAMAFKLLAPLAFVWLAFNPPLAESYGLNLTVPMLLGLFGLQTYRCFSPIEESSVATSFVSETDVHITERLAA